MRVGGICFFCFHHQGIWIDAKVVKIWGMRESFAMDILITRTTPSFVFSVFGFQVMIYKNISISIRERIFPRLFHLILHNVL